MSSLATLPAITASYTRDEQVAIFTANGQSLVGIFGENVWFGKRMGIKKPENRPIFLGMSFYVCFPKVEFRPRRYENIIDIYIYIYDYLMFQSGER